jgi:hypothetical protein
MAWFSTQSPPRVTWSVPTSPEAPEPSPYLIFHVAPVIFLYEEDFLGLYISCLGSAEALAFVAESRRLDHTYS